MNPRQEIYNKVAKHLLTQMKKSMGPIPKESNYHPVDDLCVNTCLYRGTENLKCAIGCLIPDEKYSPTFENALPRHLISAGVLPDVGDSEFYNGLQAIHDNHYPEEWPECLKYFAEDNKLVSFSA